MSLLGRSYTSPHAMAHWRNQDAVIVPTQQQHVVRGVMDSLDGKHLTLAGFWADLSATDGLHMEELVEAVSASSSLYAGPGGHGPSGPLERPFRQVCGGGLPPAISTRPWTDELR